MRVSWFVTVLLAAWALHRPAHAHIQLDEPIRRQADMSGPGLEQKTGPCGLNARSTNVTVYEPGQTITVRWSETIQHPGHFRIAFDVDGQDGFQDPICLTNCDTLQNPTFEFNNDPGILVDDILDQTAGPYSVQVTLPDTPCENCTLQLIQVMYDKAPYTLPAVDPFSDDMYYQCADIALRPGGGNVDAGPIGNPDAQADAQVDAGPDAAGLPEDSGVQGPVGQDAGAGPLVGQNNGVRTIEGDACRMFGGPSSRLSLFLVLLFIALWRRRLRAAPVRVRR